ncbi:phage/plasmid replication protein, gene II/X family [Variovorax sp. YR266]|nr:phage/plasmid replication protein, gene II/X family [Variovorax sp. YR266]
MPAAKNCLVVTVWIGALENTGIDMNFDAFDFSHCMMVDTLGLRVHNVDPSKLPNKYALVGGGDEKKWAKGSLQTAAGKKSLKVKANKARKAFDMEGSPAFLRQGHNIVSSGDVTMLAYAMAKDCNFGLQLGLKTDRAKDFLQGAGMEVTRIDTPVLLRKPAGLSSAAVINGIALSSVLAGLNTSLYVNETVYFDQQAQLAALKAYDKDAELKKKRKLEVPETPQTAALLDLAAATIRLEPVYRLKWLERRFKGRPPTPAELSPGVLAHMLAGLLDKYDLRRDIRRPLNHDALMAIPARFQRFALLWQHGHDMKLFQAKDPTEYSRAKSYLAREHSLNIDGPPPREIEDRVELGDILSPKNFMPVPAEIVADRELFFHCDMELERKHPGPRWSRPWTV